MRFSKLIAMIAIVGLATQAKADVTATPVTTPQQTQTAQPSQGVVILNTNSNANTNANANKPVQTTEQAQVQPETVVEAPPAIESEADQIRKERHEAEIQTEQTIDVKLEQSRLADEKARAERLFGDRLNPQPAVAPVAAPAPVPAPTPVAVTDDKKADPSVNIDKIEIVEPKAETKEKKEKIAKDDDVDDAVAETKMAPPAPQKEQKVYVGATLGGMEYQAANVKTNYAMGLSVGTILPSNWAIEANFMYSNHYVDNIWELPVFHEMDQYNFGVAAKYYLLNARIKPYVGAGVAYIYRKYYDRAPGFWGGNTNITLSQEETDAVNGSLMAGVDFAVSDSFLIGASAEYSRNLFDKADMPWSTYGFTSNQKLLEEIDYYTLNVTAKMMF